MSTESKKNAIEQKAIECFEDLIDIQKDISELSKHHGIQSITTYTSALVHSQLFEVPEQKGKHHLYTLNEFSELPKHTNSFVCFHDEGIKLH